MPHFSGREITWEEDKNTDEEVGEHLHDGDRDHVGKDDQEEDILIVVQEVSMPIVNGTWCSAWLQAKPAKDAKEGRDDKDKEKEPGADDEDKAVGSESGLRSQVCKVNLSIKFIQ